MQIEVNGEFEIAKRLASKWRQRFPMTYSQDFVGLLEMIRRWTGIKC